MTSKLCFLCLPGAWCPSTFYEKVIAKLLAQDYEAIALDPPSSLQESDTSAPGFYDDANFVRATIEELSSAGKTVIVVGNSYGGFLATEACKGLLQPDRLSAGKKGGVAHIIIIGSLLAAKGKSVGDMLAGHIPLDFGAPQDWFPPAPAEISWRTFFGSLPEEEGLKYGGMMRSHSSKSFMEPITFTAHEYIPTTVVIGSKDLALAAKVQEDRVDEVIAKGNNNIKKILIEADHIPMLAQADEIVKIFLEAAQQVELSNRQNVIQVQ
jgi:pimeloyl-ACP methyl ester carboxylesterase